MTTVSYQEAKKHMQLNSYSQPGKDQASGKEKKMSEEWTEVVAGNVFTFQQQGDAIEGKVVARRKSTQYENMVYDIETDDGLKTIFGTTILDSRMVKVKDGQVVKIEYIGEIKTGTGRLAKNYKVWIK